MSTSSPPPPSSSNQKGQQQQPVIQTLLESFTRCFNPLNQYSGCTKIINGGCGSDDEEIVAAQQHKHDYRRHHRGELSTSSASRATSSTATNARKTNHQHHDDNVTHDDDAMHHHRRLSGEYLEERSMKRKLEIFRCDDATMTTTTRPKLKPRDNPHGRLSPYSSTSSDDEDLIRLARSSSRKRFSCGVNLNQDSPIANVARLLNMGFVEAQKPFGLCFATPVRASSNEDISKLPDDRLTADEFIQRHTRKKNEVKSVMANSRKANEITPDRSSNSNNNTNTTADSSYNEDETIASTLYFDHKYSHLVQTRPPMPLFREDMISSGDGCGDELSEIIKRRSSSLERRVEPPPPPPPFPTVETVTNWRQRNPTPRNRGGGVGKEECPSPVKKSGAYAGFNIDSKSKDGPSSPIRIRDESMSTSTADSAEEVQSFHV